MGDMAAFECQSKASFYGQVTVRFYCDNNDNGVYDINERHAILSGTCSKLQKMPKKKFPGLCGKSEQDNFNQEDCPCKHRIEQSIKGNIAAKYECTKYHKKSPTWKIFCDSNNNGLWDNGEENYEQTERCRKFKFPTLQC